jgi:light-regulated signal transduction histidine kinase (bacteriophytochrome)
LKLLNASGVAVVLENEVLTFGTAPATGQVEDLVFWLQTNSVNKLYHASNLSGVYEGAEAYVTDASGLLALPVQPERGAYILAFRPEAVRDMAWGGNPDEAITFEPDGKRYHPRNSFRMWKKNRSKQCHTLEQGGNGDGRTVPELCCGIHLKQNVIKLAAATTP